MQNRLLDRGWKLPQKTFQALDDVKKQRLIHSILDFRFSILDSPATFIFPFSCRPNYNAVHELECRNSFASGDRGARIVHGRGAGVEIGTPWPPARLRGNGRGALWLRA